ncbi:hypothetical protein MAM1_0030c02339 [Mucor ambiguus]|uniref:Uncharacterized protein n=1 Tax=Mucor ambiguus TaxID=91626 RepID=A0A0C9LSK5_9FUNG|nr:hypothetical protein MAM1_0030c02339 [Mucor ambiguus]
MMHEVNPFVDLLKSIEELSSEHEDGLEDIRMVFRAENAPDPKSGDNDESYLEPRNSNTVVRFKGVAGNEGLSRISELNQHYVLRNLDTFET